MKIVAVIQARIASTRLHGKVLMPLAGKPLILNVIERVKRATKIDEVVLAVPSRDIDAFIPFCELTSLYGYPLDEQDLVGRYLWAAAAYDADLIVRIPGDNPCVSPEYIDEAIENYLQSASVYYSNTTGLHWDVAVDGVGCEVMSMSRLKWLDQRTQGMPAYREHPHKWFQDHRHYTLPNAMIRLDVNDQNDYEFVADIFLHFGHNRFTTAEVVAYLEGKKVTA